MESAQRFLAELMDDIQALAPLAAEGPPPRVPGVRSAVDSPLDPFHAFSQLLQVEPTSHGSLAGVRLAVKETIPIAGVPLGGHDGAGDWLPTVTAVAVERALAAGATVIGTTSLGQTAQGVTTNPLDPSRSPGYSSAGAGAVIAARLADAALGTDYAGSVRIPAAWCGVVGMKATQGAVPGFQGLPGSSTCNQIGPLTATVADNAHLLEVIAGPDWRDPLTSGAPRNPRYRDAATPDLRGLRVGVPAQAIDPLACDADALDHVERVVAGLQAEGASVVPVAVPLWEAGSRIILVLDALELLLFDRVLARGARHHDYVGIIDEHLAGRAPHPFLDHPAIRDDLASYADRPDGAMLAHARTRNLALRLRREVDEALSGVDVLLTPTTPTGPYRLAVPRTHEHLRLELWNTSPINLSGHPALSVPSGVDADGLPRGIQVIGRRHDERTVYRAGFAIERG